MKLMVSTTKGLIEETVYRPTEAPLDDILFTAPTVRKRGKHPITYYNIPCSFDIETSTLPSSEPSESVTFMYHWQMCLNTTVIFGRTWEEFIEFLKLLCDKFELSQSKRLTVYVHNLAYEWQFMKDFIPIDSVFAKSKRKPMYILSSGIEFRCSYFLSNKSLSKFCEESPSCIHRKLSGEEFDYSIIRTPDTPLTAYELSYCYNDVRGLCECISDLLIEDNIATIPLTSTGYVRRDCRSAMNTPVLRELFSDLALTPRQYILCRKMFRGGNTHSNRFFTGRIEHDMHSKDLQSSYPAAIMFDDYPITPFVEFKPTDLTDLLIMCNKYCVIMEFTLLDVSIKENIPFPYIDVAHCSRQHNITTDNGRILTADLITYSCTEVDLEIIRKQYDLTTIYIHEAYYAERGKLPRELREIMMHYYDLKTTLKGIPEKEYEYMRSKNKINSIFGMMVTDICHDEYYYDENTHEWGVSKSNLEEALEHYYSSRNNFLSYQHGVYVTANSRKRLQRAIDRVGMDSRYIDTDSLKYVGNHEDIFKDLNEYHMTIVNKCDMRSYAEKDGERYYLGTWDNDGTYDRFRTLGAKKYCYEDHKGFHITVSGINKKDGAKIIGSIENFTIGKTYQNTVIDGKQYRIGRTVAYYHESEPHEMTVEDCTFTTASNLSIIDSTYTMGVTTEYWELILNNFEKTVDFIPFT